MIIRQEINIIDSNITGATDDAARVQLDTTQYNGTVTYYFEIVGSVPSGSENITLRREGTTTDDATITVNSSTVSRYRSAAFTPPSGKTTYMVHCASTNATVRAARIIISQNAPPLTATETHVEIGNTETGKTNSSITALTNPKYWLYTAANWNGTSVFDIEVTYNVSSSKQGCTIYLQEDNGSFANWGTGGNQQLIIINGGLATTPTRDRASAYGTTFTPVNGRHYRIATVQATTKSNHSIYNARIIINQSGTAFDSQNAQSISTVGLSGGTGSSGETNQAIGQSWTASSSYFINEFWVRLAKANSPTDNLTLEILSGSINGTIIGTSNALSALTLVSLPNESMARFAFSSPVSITNGTKYYCRITRSGARDTVNNYQIEINTGSVYANGGQYVRDNNVWGSESGTNDVAFYIPNGITLLEAQYLLLNTSDGGTGLQTRQTLYDADEWGGVTNTYLHAQDATNSADSTKLTDITANPDVDITNSTVTGANQQISSILTGFVDNDEIDSNVIISTGVVGASRILVKVASPFIPQSVNQPLTSNFPNIVSV